MNRIKIKHEGRGNWGEWLLLQHRTWCNTRLQEPEEQNLMLQEPEVQEQEELQAVQQALQWPGVCPGLHSKCQSTRYESLWTPPRKLSDNDSL